jgi:hypothetical protein
MFGEVPSRPRRGEASVASTAATKVAKTVILSISRVEEVRGGGTLVNKVWNWVCRGKAEGRRKRGMEAF